MISHFEAEQSVIGGIILDAPKALPIAEKELSDSDFSVPEFRTIYEKIEKLHAEKKPIDSVTLINELGSEYRETVMVAASCIPSLAHFFAYVQNVKENSKREKLLEKANGLVSQINGVDTIDDLRQTVSEMSGVLNADKIEKSSAAADLFLDFLKRKENKQKHIPTGFAELDRYLYLDPGDFIIVGGRPSSGKTAFTLQMLLKMSREYKVGYFSLETSREGIADRLISNFSRTDFGKINRSEFTDEDWIQITKCYDDFSKLNLEVIEAAGWGVQQVRGYTAMNQYDVIFIDYLTLLTGRGKDSVEKASNISKDLHTMAQADKVTVFALSQLNRKGAESPDMTSLRESGQIEQDADAILLLSYDVYEPEERELTIAKNKKGRIGKIKLRFDGSIQTFWVEETER